MAENFPRRRSLASSTLINRRTRESDAGSAGYDTQPRDGGGGAGGDGGGLRTLSLDSSER